MQWISINICDYFIFKIGNPENKYGWDNVAPLNWQKKKKTVRGAERWEELNGERDWTERDWAVRGAKRWEGLNGERSWPVRETEQWERLSSERDWAVRGAEHVDVWLTSDPKPSLAQLVRSFMIPGISLGLLLGRCYRLQRWHLRYSSVFIPRKHPNSCCYDEDQCRRKVNPRTRRRGKRSATVFRE